MDNKISPYWINGILHLDIKEKQKDGFSQERDLLLSGKQFKEYIQFIRKQKKIDLGYLNKLKNDLKKHPYLKFANKRRKLTNKDIMIGSSYFKQSEALIASYNQKLSIIYKYINDRLDMDDIEKIRLLYGLSKAWEFPLVEYILTDIMSKPSFEPRVEFMKGIYKENHRLKIEIFGNSKPEDIKRIWKTNIEGYLKFLPDYKIKGGRYKPALNRDMDIEKLYSSGIRGKQLKEVLAKKYPELEFKPELVRKIRERIKKKRDIRTR